LTGIMVHLAAVTNLYAVVRSHFVLRRGLPLCSLALLFVLLSSTAPWGPVDGFCCSLAAICLLALCRLLPGLFGTLATLLVTLGRHPRRIDHRRGRRHRVRHRIVRRVGRSPRQMVRVAQVLIVGGYGVFGRLLAVELLRTTNAHIVIAGRDPATARRACRDL